VTKGNSTVANEDTLSGDQVRDVSFVLYGLSFEADQYNSFSTVLQWHDKASL
jgi:hypothetical protein